MQIIVAKEIWYFACERINKYNICFWKAEVQTYPGVMVKYIKCYNLYHLGSSNLNRGIHGQLL
jgi:hypothetical protein